MKFNLPYLLRRFLIMTLRYFVGGLLLLPCLFAYEHASQDGPPSVYFSVSCFLIGFTLVALSWYLIGRFFQFKEALDFDQIYKNGENFHTLSKPQVDQFLPNFNYGAATIVIIGGIIPNASQSDSMQIRHVSNLVTQSQWRSIEVSHPRISTATRGVDV